MTWPNLFSTSYLLLAYLLLTESIAFAEGDVPSGTGYPFQMMANAAETHDMNRLIEPTSPILGYQLVTYIKNKQHEPSDVLHSLKSFSGACEREITKSCIAYFNVMLPELQKHQEQYQIEHIPTDALEYTEVEVSAIPLEVLVPLHGSYLQTLSESNDFVNENNLSVASDSARRLAEEFIDRRENCPTVLPMLKESNPWKKYLPAHFRELVEINAEVSAAESAFPRVQHSINGYLRSVYKYLCTHEDLEGLLESTYKAQRTWLKLNDKGIPTTTLFEYVESSLIQRGYTEKDVLMVMSYASRNMPNIDVEYALYPSQALALEVYFWKMKPLLNEASSNHLEHVFPMHRFQRNPMIYHYATASYLAYEIRSAGYTTPMAIFFAFASKAGYKMYKFKHGLSKESLKDDGFQNISDMLHAQGTIPGVIAGYYGGKYGVTLARQARRFQRE